MSDERSWQELLRNNPLKLSGTEIQEGQKAPDFSVLNNSFERVRLSDAQGQTVIVASVLSVDTPLCDTLIRRLNDMPGRADTDIWAISMDVPFVQKRWCESMGVHRVKTFSDFRDRSFAQSYGVLIKEGPLAGLAARAVFVITKERNVAYAWYPKEIFDEPDYNRLLIG